MNEEFKFGTIVKEDEISRRQVNVFHILCIVYMHVYIYIYIYINLETKYI